jgi:hypothetical protein
MNGSGRTQKTPEERKGRNRNFPESFSLFRLNRISHIL